MTGPGTATLRPPSFQDGGPAMFSWLQSMRDEHPVHHDGHGTCHVFRYTDVSAVINDPATFSSDQARVMPEAARWTRGNLNAIDPPAHRELRQIVSQVFTPHLVDALRPQIERVCSELLDEMAGAVEWDLVDRLARPLPVIVIAQLLGIPLRDRELFHAWSDQLLATRLDYRDPTASAAAYESATGELTAYLLGQCLERRRRPDSDLISRLVEAQAHGRHLDDVEVVNFAALLLMAGHLSTTASLGNTVLCLQDNPGVAAELRVDRGLLPAVVDEALRYRPPFAMLGRFARVDTWIGAQEVPAGTVVVPWLLSANHDERRFDHPERFDVRRTGRPHATFGHGIHFCLGAPLARLEATVALAALLDRYDDIRVTPGSRLGFYEHSIFAARGIPITVTRGAAQ